MIKFLLSSLFGFITIVSLSQANKSFIDENEVKRIEATLSADDMEGRQAFTRGNKKAADFIAKEFKKIGLDSLNGTKNYLQSFNILKPKTISVSASFNNEAVDPERIIVYTCQPDLSITAKSAFKKIYVKSVQELRENAGNFTSLKENMLVFVDTSLSKNFTRLASRKPYFFKSDKSVVFVLGNYDTDNYQIKAKIDISDNQSEAANVVGVLPGTSKKNEFVIFSAHYDHLGIEKATNGDSIYNGANDDASGVTAVISLANYYKALHNNERTLIFVAFTAEEIGGYGSQYFSRQVDPKTVVALFNIEMIGTESRWGRNSAYITGFEKSDLGKILQKNLQGSIFSFYPDPYPQEDLFYRSDNATLARLGVPAHTISTSKMDNEPNYHKLSDEISTLDLSNMTQIIQSIATSARSIVDGKDSPTRVSLN